VEVENRHLDPVRRALTSTPLVGPLVVAAYDPRRWSAGEWTMRRSPTDVIAWCRDQSVQSSIDWTFHCLGMAGAAWDLHPSGAWPDAWDAFNRTTQAHQPSEPAPAGAPVWFDLIARGKRLGHVAIADAPGFCWSIDFVRHGKIDRVEVSRIVRGWGARYVGWSTDLEGFDLPFSSVPRVGRPTTDPGPRPRGDDMVLTRFQCTDAFAAFIGPATAVGVANFVEWADPDTDRKFAPFVEARRDITVDQCKSFHLLGPLPIANERTWTSEDFRRHTP
jgi:hypothetical protein